MTRLENDVFPEIGHLQIDRIEPPTVLDMLRKIEKRGAHYGEKGQRALQPSFPLCYRHIALLTGSLPRFTRRPQAFAAGQAHKAVSLKDLPELLRRIDRHAEDFRDASAVTQLALQLVSITLLRTTELRAAEWPELEALETDSPLWRVPDERMKMKDREGI